LAWLAVAGTAPALALPVGSPVPGFSLPGIDGKPRSLQAELAAHRAVVLLFLGVRCPYSNAYNQRFAELDRWLHDRGGQVTLLAIDSNADESEEQIRQFAAQQKFAFPILKDEDQKIADSLGARKTPEVFLIARPGKLVYAGRIDDDTEGTQIHRQDLRLAVEDWLSTGKVRVAQTKAFGCSIVRK
jgi:peroxiredoxin